MIRTCILCASLLFVFNPVVSAQTSTHISGKELGAVYKSIASDLAELDQFRNKDFILDTRELMWFDESLRGGVREHCQFGQPHNEEVSNYLRDTNVISAEWSPINNSTNPTNMSLCRGDTSTVALAFSVPRMTENNQIEVLLYSDTKHYAESRGRVMVAMSIRLFKLEKTEQGWTVVEQIILVIT